MQKAETEAINLIVFEYNQAHPGHVKMLNNMKPAFSEKILLVDFF